MCTHTCTRMISQPKDRIRWITESHHTPKRWTSQDGFPRKDLQDAKSKELIAELKPQIVEQVKVWAIWAAGAGCCSVWSTNINDVWTDPNTSNTASMTIIWVNWIKIRMGLEFRELRGPKICGTWDLKGPDLMVFASPNASIGIHWRQWTLTMQPQRCQGSTSRITLRRVAVVSSASCWDSRNGFFIELVGNHQWIRFLVSNMQTINSPCSSWLIISISPRNLLQAFWRNKGSASACTPWGDDSNQGGGSAVRKSPNYGKHVHGGSSGPPWRRAAEPIWALTKNNDMDMGHCVPKTTISLNG